MLAISSSAINRMISAIMEKKKHETDPGPVKLENAANVSIIYSLLSIFLAFSFYLLFYRFSGNFYRSIDG